VLFYSQDMVLFNDSIYYNIAYGNLSATREQVEAAAAAAKVSLALQRSVGPCAAAALTCPVVAAAAAAASTCAAAGGVPGVITACKALHSRCNS
jgi:hypothetical protein